MNLCELSTAELARRLRVGDLYLRTGPFVYSLKTPLANLAEAIRFLYADFPVVDDCQFADFHVSIPKVCGWGRWLRPRANLFSGGESQFTPFPARMALPYLEWGLNRCVYRHAQHFLLVHAAVLERGGRALLIVGDTGSGKSTLCAGLTLGGWRLLSDELALLSPQDGTVAALARPIILKNESIDVLRRLAPETPFGPLCEGTPKGSVVHVRPPSDAVRRSGERALPAWIAFVDYQTEAALKREEIPKARAMLNVARFTFNYGSQGEAGFEALGQMIDRCQCFRLTYGDLADAISWFDNVECHENPMVSTR